MMDQLGIKALRPGPSGNEQDPNHANFDEAKANPFGDLPDPLTLKNGQKVATAEQWWKQRRPEIVEDFEREVLGRIPPNVPKVIWTAKSTNDSKAGAFPVVEKQLIGHVDNSAYPSINVDIEMTLVTPGNAKYPVPVVIMFSSAFIRQFIASHPEFKKMIGSDPPSTEQLIANGWGYALLDTSTAGAAWRTALVSQNGDNQDINGPGLAMANGAMFSAESSPPGASRVVVRPGALSQGSAAHCASGGRCTTAGRLRSHRQPRLP